MKALAPSRRDRLRAMLADLMMPGALEAIDDILSAADGGTISAAEAIEQLLNAQIVLRNNRRLQTAMRSSRLPAVKTLDQFDFAFQPSIKREQIESLHELGFLDRGENVILFGPPGKTHLAISLAIAAAEAGRRVYYGTLAGLIESLTEAKAAGNLSRRLRVLTHPALLVVDEIGYLPVNQDGAVLFFQLINGTIEPRTGRGLGRRPTRLLRHARGADRIPHRGQGRRQPVRRLAFSRPRSQVRRIPPRSRLWAKERSTITATQQGPLASPAGGRRDRLPPGHSGRRRARFSRVLGSIALVGRVQLRHHHRPVSDRVLGLVGQSWRS